MKKIIAFFGLAFVGVMIFPALASAHVLITSADNQKGAILHIIPDDDPIAGEEATLMFDTQEGLMDEDTKVTLIINGEAQTDEIETSIKDSLVSAKYTFPSQGVYTIKYALTDDNEEYVFVYTARIARGIAGAHNTQPSYIWAEATLFVCGGLLLVLLIIAWNHRKDILKFSQL